MNLLADRGRFEVALNELLRVQLPKLTARVGRLVLLDRTRRRSRARRRPVLRRFDLEQVCLLPVSEPERLTTARQHLQQGLACGSRRRRVAELRMAGYRADEIALILQVRKRTVEKDWQMAAGEQACAGE